MTLQVKLITFFITCLVLAASLLFSADIAKANECQIAVSKSINDSFSEIKVILDDLEKNSNGRFSYYESPVNNMYQALNNLAAQPFKIIIATSSEIEKIPTPEPNSWVVEKGRDLEAEVFLIGREEKTLLQFQKPKFAYQPDESLKNFWVDIVKGCLYKYCPEANWPTSPITDLTNENLQDCDIIIVKYYPTLKKRVGGECLHEIWGLTNFPDIPVSYCDDNDAEFKAALLQCFESVSSRCPIVDVQYGLKEYSNLNRFAKVVGKDEEVLRETLKDLCHVQVVTKKEMIIVIYLEANEGFVKEFWNSLYKRFMAIKYSFQENRENPELIFLMQQYPKGYEILTTGLRGIIEVANRYYDIADNCYEELDDMFGIPVIKEKLARGEPLNEEKELKKIYETSELFREYFEKRTELSRERIDINLLHAKWKSSRLLYFIHQHYYNLARKFRDQPDKRKDAEAHSKENLELAKKEVESWGQDINTVRTKNDFDYQTLRRKESFHFNSDICDEFKKILKIP